jgi:hypothetical protein
VRNDAKELAMIAHRRTWFYRLAGQRFAQTISFKIPLTAQQARELLFRQFGSMPVELWSH